MRRKTAYGTIRTAQFFSCGCPKTVLCFRLRGHVLLTNNIARAAGKECPHILRRDFMQTDACFPRCPRDMRRKETIRRAEQRIVRAIKPYGVDSLTKTSYKYNDGVVGYGGKLNIRPAFQREFIYKDKQRTGSDVLLHRRI